MFIKMDIKIQKHTRAVSQSDYKGIFNTGDYDPNKPKIALCHSQINNVGQYFGNSMPINSIWH